MPVDGAAAPQMRRTERHSGATAHIRHRRVAVLRATSSVAVLGQKFAHLCLVLSCDKQGTSAERERGARLRVLVAKQLDA